MTNKWSRITRRGATLQNITDALNEHSRTDHTETTYIHIDHFQIKLSWWKDELEEYWLPRLAEYKAKLADWNKWNKENEAEIKAEETRRANTKRAKKQAKLTEYHLNLLKRQQQIEQEIKETKQRLK